VLPWLVEAAEPLTAFARYFLCDVHVNQLQLDELYAVLRALKASEISVVFGTMERLQQVLSACNRKINTAFVERWNLDIRQRVAAVGRRVNTLCQGEDGIRQQLMVYHAYYNFCLPHSSLRQPLPVPEITHGSGSAQLWRPCTAAMAAGLTDHVWSLKEGCSIACRRGRSRSWSRKRCQWMLVAVRG
jgi:hypothetical protein